MAGWTLNVCIQIHPGHNIFCFFSSNFSNPKNSSLDWRGGNNSVPGLRFILQWHLYFCFCVAAACLFWHGLPNCCIVSENHIWLPIRVYFVNAFHFTLISWTFWSITCEEKRKDYIFPFRLILLCWTCQWWL